MKKITKNGLIYIKLEKRDWSGDWRGFCDAIKKLDGVTFNPVELDEDGWWFIPKQHAPRISIIYYDHIGKTLFDAQADKDAGFEPIKRTVGRFARKSA